MSVAETRRRALLREGRFFQVYSCGTNAPRFALRRYISLLPPTCEPLRLPMLCRTCPSVLAFFEPLPLLPKSAASREFELRLFLTMLVTEATPWGALQSRAAANRGPAQLIIGMLGFGLVELLVFPARLATHRFSWWPPRSG